MAGQKLLLDRTDSKWLSALPGHLKWLSKAFKARGSHITRTHKVYLQSVGPKVPLADLYCVFIELVDLKKVTLHVTNNNGTRLTLSYLSKQIWQFVNSSIYNSI